MYICSSLSFYLYVCTCVNIFMHIHSLLLYAQGPEASQYLLHASRCRGSDVYKINKYLTRKENVNKKDKIQCLDRYLGENVGIKCTFLEDD